MNKVYLGIIAILVIIIVAGVYKFMIAGSGLKSTDGRVTLQLEPGERDLVLTEMRGFLLSVQQIVKGASENDMKLVAEYARKAGRAAQADVPPSLMGKLPIEFKQLGFDTHSKFDQLAMDASELGDANHVLTELTTLMNNCVACHASYRIDPVPQPGK
ncbi:MAG: hypothetical protein GC149_13570 [Gammaproteobacteria bacterium]|nr:hypothetical protein [Gammaproteobacteria bacterium]